MAIRRAAHVLQAIEAQAKQQAWALPVTAWRTAYGRRPLPREARRRAQPAPHGFPSALPIAADHALFHAPYNKLVQKAFARLVYTDIVK